MKLLKNLYKDMFLHRRVRMKSNCEIAPVDITGTVTGLGKNGSETLFYIKSEKNGKIYTIGENSKDLMWEFM